MASEAISRFDQWVDTHHVDLSDLAQVRHEATLFALEGDMTLDERHEKHLVLHGFPYRKSEKATATEFRATHCWACKHNISTTTDRQCGNCMWILCSCGACGCGYTRL